MYRLGEDVVGTLNLGEGTVACLQVRKEQLCCARPEGLGWKRGLHEEGWFGEVEIGVPQGYHSPAVQISKCLLVYVSLAPSFQ